MKISQHPQMKLLEQQMATAPCAFATLTQQPQEQPPPQRPRLRLPTMMLTTMKLKEGRQNSDD
jgi:hypothetical protein